MDSNLRPGERLDDLLIGNLKIIQHEKEFCFSLDAVLLAHFATIRPGWASADLGAGTGVLGLLLAARGAGQVTGVEINSYMAHMAERTIELNGLSERLHVVCADVREIKNVLNAGEMELVVANPPYRLQGGGLISSNDRIAAARHEISGRLEDFIAAASYLVKFRGRFAIVHLPERMPAVLQSMMKYGLEPKRLRLVYPSIEQKPKFLLVEGVRGGRPGLDVLPPLFIYGSDGNYSKEINAYYPNKPQDR
jgi:tRNA1Val (adenine37-N6)-methyltransferase